MTPLKCEISGNQCGTDTHLIGYPCQCATCRRAKIYPCEECGKLRSQDEGGTIFTVCDACWDKIHSSERPISDLRS